MKKMNTLLSLVAIVALAVPAFAGGDYEKCGSGTQECLDKMSEHMQSKGWIGIELERRDDGRAVRFVVDPEPLPEQRALRDAWISNP